jgi:hypothetical protein
MRTLFLPIAAACLLFAGLAHADEIPSPPQSPVQPDIALFMSVSQSPDQTWDQSMFESWFIHDYGWGVGTHSGGFMIAISTMPSPMGFSVDIRVESKDGFARDYELENCQFVYVTLGEEMGSCADATDAQWKAMFRQAQVLLYRLPDGTIK